jgi:hypothetical protein
MPSVLTLLGDIVGEALLAPVLVGGVAIAAATSPALRKRIRQWSVQATAAAMAAREMAARQLTSATNGGAGGLTRQVKHRVMQAAAEAREEWEVFVEEARQVRADAATPKSHRAPSRSGTEMHETSASPRPRRRAGASRGRRR